MGVLFLGGLTFVACNCLHLAFPLGKSKWGWDGDKNKVETREGEIVAWWHYLNTCLSLRMTHPWTFPLPGLIDSLVCLSWFEVGFLHLKTTGNWRGTFCFLFTRGVEKQQGPFAYDLDHRSPTTSQVLIFSCSLLVFPTHLLTQVLEASLKWISHLWNKGKQKLVRKRKHFTRDRIFCQHQPV